MLKAVADHDIWIQPYFFGMIGASNDLNYFNAPLFSMMFWRLEDLSISKSMVTNITRGII